MRSIAIILSLVLILFPFSQVQATIIHVPGDSATIQGGINGAVNGDTVLVASGTYYEHIDFNGKAITVTSEAGPATTTVTKVYDGESIVTFFSGEDTTSILDGFTITGAESADSGGGVYCSGSSPKIRNCVITGNSAVVRGGGFCCNTGHPVLESNQITSNSGGGGGGGIYLENCSASVRDNLIKDNYAPGDGGGMRLYLCYGTRVERNLIISNSTDNLGGGVFLSEGMANAVVNNTIVSNAAGNAGGGILIWYTAFNSVYNNIVINSPTGYGILSQGGSPSTVEYNDVWNNLPADYYGLTPGEGSMSVDPLFCDPENGDYYLYDISQCIGAGENGTDMGALGVGCTYSAAIPFAPPVDYDVSVDPRGIFCADLDGDMDVDLAVTGYYGNQVSILKNNGDGTFQAPVLYEVGDWPYSVFCADLDGDLDLDLAVPNQYSDSISILRNNGDGTFQPAVNYGADSLPYSVFCADLDGDGDLDLAVANAGDDNVAILKNNGDGTFQDAVYYETGGWPRSVFCADLDGDLDADLAVAAGDVSILINNGDATFQPPVYYRTVESPQDIFCADLDGDSDFDLAVAHANSPSGGVSILKNNGDGTFQDAVGHEAGINPCWVFCADLDGDTDLDLAVSNHAGNLAILANNGDGSFQTPQYYSTAEGPFTGLFCADLDGDIDIDLAIGHANTNNVSIYLNLSNSRPDPFSLLYPSDLDSIGGPIVDLDWQDAVDPDLDDTVFYTALISKSEAFHPDSTATYEGLPQSEYTDSLGVGLYYWKAKAYDTWDAVTWSNETWSFYAFIPGDVNGDWLIGPGDVVYLINFMFGQGPPPNPFAAGDANCDGYVIPGDIVYLINYLFRDGPPPCEP